MKTKKKLKIGMGILTLILLCIAIFIPDNSITLFFSVVHSIDAEGNQIQYTEVYQYNGSAYILKMNTSTSNTCRLDPLLNVKFIVCVRYNSSLSSSNTTVLTYTSVKMNITETVNSTVIWNNQILLNYTNTLSGSYWYVKKYGIWNTNLPNTNGVYNCTIKYFAYW